jgi:signal transduction histidine kinase/pSer/pThr/pTyr-binding forkhead associated (FHA) protein
VPTLHVLRGPDKGETYQIVDGHNVIGRSSDTVHLNDNTVSRQHAELVLDNDEWKLVDRGSSNGTLLNGVRIQMPTTIRHGDQIKVGGTLMVFSGDDSVRRFSGPAGAGALVDLDASRPMMDSSILSAVSSAEDSVILATPETADAVHAWNVMYRIAEIIGQVTSLDDFLEYVSDILYDHLPVDQVFILLRDPSSGEFEPQVARYRTSKPGEEPKIKASQTIVNHVINANEGILCANAMTDPRFAAEANMGSIHDLGLRSIICVPIPTHDEVKGVIHVDCAMFKHVYTHDQLRLVSAIGRLAGMAIENIRLLESRMQNERMAAVGETVAYLSHYIRNIAQGLGSGADVIEMGLKRKNMDTVGQGWRILKRNVDRTLLLTTNMLTFSKDRQPMVEVTQLNKIIEDVVQLTVSAADDKQVMLLTDLDEMPAAPLDTEGVHHVLLNIVNNAIEACPNEGGRVTIESSYKASGGYVQVKVSDNGGGIPDERLALIFDAFHSTKGHGGTGLGLAAAQKVVREMRGSIDVHSTPGEGTTFTVSIPVNEGGPRDKDGTIHPM